MKKTLLYRLFKIGKMPGKLKKVLETENLILFDEGIGGWLIMKNIRAPGKRFKHRIVGFTGFLAVTEKRIIAYSYWKHILNVPVDHPNFRTLRCELANPCRIEITYESSHFNEKWTGEIKLRFNTEKASEFDSAIMRLQA